MKHTKRQRLLILSTVLIININIINNCAKNILHACEHTHTLPPPPTVGDGDDKQMQGAFEGRRKLQWYGHVSCSSGLVKTILQGKVKGGRRKGRQSKRKTTSGNGQAWSSPSPRGQWRTGRNGGNWLRNHLWCPNNPRG